MSQGISQRLRFNGAAILVYLAFLLAPQVVVGADTVEDHVDPYERAHQNWQNKTPLSSKIIKGRSVALGYRQWQVAILNASIPDSLYDHFCSGTLITAHWVITAARCVARRQATELTVLTGTNSLDFGGQKKKVISIIVHPAYDSRTFENDLALLFLDTPTVHAHNAYPQFPSVKVEQQLIEEQEKVEIAGWGNTYDFSAKSRDLMEAEAPLVPYHLCSAPDSHGQLLKASMVCAGYEDGRTDACDGDTGGAATVRHYSQELFIGIKSWGDCAAPKKYAVFTRIAPYLGWIRANLASIRSRTEYFFQ